MRYKIPSKCIKSLKFTFVKFKENLFLLQILSVYSQNLEMKEDSVLQLAIHIFKINFHAQCMQKSFQKFNETNIIYNKIFNIYKFCFPKSKAIKF